MSHKHSYNSESANQEILNKSLDMVDNITEDIVYDENDPEISHVETELKTPTGKSNNKTTEPVESLTFRVGSKVIISSKSTKDAVGRTLSKTAKNVVYRVRRIYPNGSILIKSRYLAYTFTTNDLKIV